MKQLIATLVLVLFATPALADTWVKGHYREDGRWVPGYWRSDANDTKEDNWGTPGNYNPRTGRVGGEDPPKPKREDWRQNTTTGPGPSSRVGPKIEMPKLGEKKCRRESVLDPPCD